MTALAEHGTKIIALQEAAERLGREIKTQMHTLLGKPEPPLADDTCTCKECSKWSRLLSSTGRTVTVGECEYGSGLTTEADSCPRFAKRS